MASRKLAFTLPQELATEFLARVPASLRSQYVAVAIADKLRTREQQLVRACEIANNSADLREIESSFDSLADGSDVVQEPWYSPGAAKSGGFVSIQLWDQRLRRHGHVILSGDVLTDYAEPL